MSNLKKMLFAGWLGSGGVTPELVIDDTTITYASAVTRAGARVPGGPNLWEKQLFYHNGNTHLLFAQDWDTFFSRTHIITNYEHWGLDKIHPIGRSPGSDVHAQPSGIMVGNKLYVGQEIPHDTPIRLFRANNDNDVYSFEEPATTIGTFNAYAIFFHLQDGRYVQLGQGINSVEATINIGDSNFSNWGATTKFAERIAPNANYQSVPLNYEISADGWKYFCVNVREVGTGDEWYERCLLKTQDFDTFYNFTETFSKQLSVQGTISAAELVANFLYYDPGASDGLFPQCAIDASENFYATSFNGTDYIFIHWLQGQSSPTEVTITGITDFVQGSGALEQTSAISAVVPFSSSDVRIFVRRDPGAFAKIYQYKTADLGQTWTLIGDVFPDVNTDLGLFSLPINYLDIPDNKNFFVAAGQLKAASTDQSDIYIRKAAIGEIQAVTTPYDVGYTFSEYNALSGNIRSYFTEAAYVTKVGANVSALVDQSVSALNATGFNNPQWLSDDGEYIHLNRTSSRYFSITSPADIAAMNQGTVIFVARKNTSSATFAFLLTGADASSVTNRIGFAIRQDGVNNNAMRFDNQGAGISGGEWIQYGDDDVGTGWNIYVWQVSNGFVSTMWMNGKKQNWNFSGTGDGQQYNRNGFYFNDTTITNVEIGRWTRLSTSSYYDFSFKHCAIFNRPLTLDEIRKSCKFLADRYSINLVNHFQ